MTAPVHLIPAGSPSDASAAQPSPCAVGAVIPAHAPRPDASAALSPPGAAEAHDPRIAALTQHELRALDFIRDSITRTGTAPTLVEVAAALGMYSRSNVHRIVESLVRARLLIKTASRLRGLALPDGPLLSGVPTQLLRAELARRDDMPGVIEAFKWALGMADEALAMRQASDDPEDTDPDMLAMHFAAREQAGAVLDQLRGGQ